MNDEISACCGAEVVESYRENPRDHHDPIAIYRCADCGEECEVEGGVEDDFSGPVLGEDR